jgi:hypothetical protein|tara:strand:+ start:313 stop:618 length:306 start_codon:yes stop_codon:yes gene_type:complete
MHWVDGGETSLANTLLLCSKHHQLLHEGGYTINKNFEDGWYFRHNNGTIIPEGSVYKPTLYDASRDAFVDQDDVREPSPNAWVSNKVCHSTHVLGDWHAAP